MASKKWSKADPASTGAKKPDRPAEAQLAAAPGSIRGRVAIIGLCLAIMVLGVIVMSRQRKATPVKPVVVQTQAAAPGAEILAAFAGSASCRECHKEAFEKWAGSHHALAERAMDAKLDDAAFVPARSFKHGTQQTDVRKSSGMFQVTADGPGKQRQAFDIERAIGVAPLVQYLTPFEGGRLQTLEASYDPKDNEWFNVYGNEDRQPGEWGHWTGRGMNWNSMCAVCHNTRLLKNYDPKTDAYRTSMVELGVGCESCHGPMKDHVVWQEDWKKRQGEGSTGGEKMGRWGDGEVGSKTTDHGQRTGDQSAIGNPQSAISGLNTQHSAPSSLNPEPRTLKPPKDPTIKKVSRKQMFETCGGCHSRRAELTGNFAPRDNYYDHHWLVIPDSSDIFYPDGQIREEDYEYTSFLSSRMFAGGVRCVDCHEPHGSKPLLQGNSLCMKCHSGSFPNAPIIDPAAHSFHKPDSTGSLCVNCHMPQTVYMQKHWRHDHGFTIPDPLLTKEHGIPNACNKCHDHKKESIEWSIEAVDKWYGAKMDRPSRHRARAVAQARQLKPEAREALLKILKEERITMWRATAASLLGGYLDSEGVAAALIAATKHADPLVRENAARALTPLAMNAGDPANAVLRNLLHDPSRAVRVRAAWVLHRALDMESKAGIELLDYLNHNSDQPSGLMQMGLLRVARRDVDGAVDLFQKAVRWDENSAPFHDALAVGLAMQGRDFDALRHAQKAASLDPRDAELQFKLALAYGGVNEVDKTIEHLRQTIKLNSSHSRAWYNLGLAYSQKRQFAPAIEALQRAEKLAPRDPGIPYALATIYLNQGDAASAKSAALRALQIDPTYQPAIELMRRWGR